MTLFTSERSSIAGVLIILVVVAGIVGGLYALHQHNKVAWDFKDACESTCAPYAPRVIDAQCECMDDEKRWVVQE